MSDLTFFEISFIIKYCAVPSAVVKTLMGKPRSSHLLDTLGTKWGNQGQIQTLCCVGICKLYD